MARKERQPIQIQLYPTEIELVERLQSATGISKVEITTRLLTWFVNQPRLAQLLILGNFDDVPDEKNDVWDRIVREGKAPPQKQHAG